MLLFGGREIDVELLTGFEFLGSFRIKRSQEDVSARGPFEEILVFFAAGRNGHQLDLKYGVW